MSRIALIALALISACDVGVQGRDPGDDDDPPTGGDDDSPSDDGTSGDDPGDAPGDDPFAAVRALFDDTVGPTLMAKCSGCHGGPGASPLKFVPAEISTLYDSVASYESLVAGFDQALAPLLARLVPGPHYEVVYTTEEAAAVAAWLEAERVARADGGEPPPPTGGETPGQASDRIITAWSGCMELAAWEAEGMAAAWANLRSSEGPCIRCHVNGQAGFLATDDSVRMFNIVASDPYFMLTFFAADVTDVANAKMVVNVDEFVRVANGTPPFLEHPQFDTQNEAMAALERFYQRTVTRQASGLCDPPRIAP